MITPSGRTMTSFPPYRSRVLRSFLLGLPGVLILPLAVEPPPGIPPLALAANPALLLLLASLAGGWAAPRIGAASRVILGSPVRARAVLSSLLLGVALGLLTTLIDAWLSPWWRGMRNGPPALIDEVDPLQTTFGVLYGGFTEEVLMRWGMLSLLAVGLLQLVPRRAALLIATVFAAALFAAAHLPALVAQGHTLSPELLTRTLVFNTLLGLAFGWAFLRHSLEAAIGMHAGFHLGVAILVVALGITYA